MALKLFNTLSRSVEEFVPMDPAGLKVGMYCCGPTVHDSAHIGNFRTFVFADLVRRYLAFKGFQVFHVMNITDVEDKIIARIRTANTSLREYTGKYEAEFFEDLKSLGCRMPDQIPRATGFIPEIVALIEKLVARGVAYQAPDGSVYFSIDKYRGCGCNYGQLLKLNFEEMRSGERVRGDEYAKESLADFALWKARVPDDGAVFWPSPWGEGRPGWHVECSAMSMKLLGPSFDLHLGGEDLIFPHHEDEIAQSEGAGLQLPGQRFVKYWMHGAHLLVEGKKMAKSLGNFFTLKDLYAKGYTGREIRCLLLRAHYRETFNFTIDGLEDARKSLARIDECLGKLREVATTNVAVKTSPELHKTVEKLGISPNEQSQIESPLLNSFAQSLDEDLNISGAWGVIFEWVRDTNRQLAENTLTPARASAMLATWTLIDGVLGMGPPPSAEVPAELNALLEQRLAARKARDFKRADAIRDELKAKGWVIEDTPVGARLKPV